MTLSGLAYAFIEGGDRLIFVDCGERRHIGRITSSVAGWCRPRGKSGSGHPALDMPIAFG
jgi:hypothetical protein